MEKHYRFMLDENQWSVLVNILLEKWETWKQAGDTRASLAWQTYWNTSHAPLKKQFLRRRTSRELTVTREQQGLMFRILCDAHAARLQKGAKERQR